MLMDAGSHLPNNRDRDRVLAVIKKAGVKKIDYMVATHYHNDHYGAIPDLAAMIPISNFVDHGAFVQYAKGPEWYKVWFALWPHNAVEAPQMDEQFDNYRKVTEKGHHIVVDAGDKIPLKGLDVTVVTSQGNHITKPLAGAGKPNPGCASTEIRTFDPSEDAQSVGMVISYGKFRFVNLGDLTWNEVIRVILSQRSDRQGGSVYGDSSRHELSKRDRRYRLGTFVLHAGGDAGAEPAGRRGILRTAVPQGQFAAGLAGSPYRQEPGGLLADQLPSARRQGE